MSSSYQHSVPTPPSVWNTFIDQEKKEEYYKKILRQLKHDQHEGHTIYPPYEHIFEAYRMTPFEHIKVVIVGQDPYHGPKQAHGLAFSVPRGVPIPPSLKNIFKELEHDLHIPRPSHGDLSSWAQQGVFLLNTSLTVRAHHAGSHSQFGWQQLTQRTLHLISSEKKHVVFLCWGSHAKRFAEHVDTQKHCLLTSAHPSPLSAYHGFFGCRHFSQCNDYLRQHHIEEIDWQLPP